MFARRDGRWWSSGPSQLLTGCLWMSGFRSSISRVGSPRIFRLTRSVSSMTDDAARPRQARDLRRGRVVRSGDHGPLVRGDRHCWDRRWLIPAAPRRLDYDSSGCVSGSLGNVADEPRGAAKRRDGRRTRTTSRVGASAPSPPGTRTARRPRRHLARTDSRKSVARFFTDEPAALTECDGLRPSRGSDTPCPRCAGSDVRR